MVKDKIIKFEKSVIQHGKLNDRIYLICLGNSRVPSVIKKLDKLAKENLYAKIFAKVPEWAAKQFEAAGYKLEAKVPCFYDGQVGAYFMGKYFDEQRGKFVEEQKIKEILKISKQKSADKKDFSANGQFRTENLSVSRSRSRLYRRNNA